MSEQESAGEAGEEYGAASPLPLIVVFGIGIGLIVFLLLFLYVLPSQPVHRLDVSVENASINIVRVGNNTYTVYIEFALTNHMSTRSIMLNRIIIDDKDYMMPSNTIGPGETRVFNMTLYRETSRPPRWSGEKKVVFEYIYLDNGEIHRAEYNVRVVRR